MSFRKTSSLFLVLVFYFAIFDGLAGPGDTTTIQTFTFGSPLEGKFLFPSGSRRWSKILMDYTLKCNPAQAPACGEWDYLTYTYLYKHTGQWDSTKYFHANFTFNGETPDSLMYCNSVSRSFIPWFEFSNLTPPALTVLSGDSTLKTHYCFGNESGDARSQFLYTVQELLQAGLFPGDLTGLRFKFSAMGSSLKRLTIRIKNTAFDTLDENRIESSGFTEVFRRDWEFAGPGWQVLPFTFPFTWNGTSNILLDISYEARQPGESNETWSGNPGRFSLSCPPQPDGFLKFRDLDGVVIPASVFQGLDSGVTIAFWQFGDPLEQPQNSSIFEGLDSAGRRVLNVHLPWSNGRVYWDAGRDSAGYDRINTVISDPSKYRGKWNHWAFTKDAVKGRMRIYQNGQLFFTQGSRHRMMDGITSFRIGSDGSGSGMFYDGSIDEFCILKKALSDTAIRSIMYTDMEPSHPDYPHLVAYYQFNDNQGFSAHNAAPGGQDATLTGYPEWQNYRGRDRFRNFIRQENRPCIMFEQGTYDPASLDSTLKIDTVSKSPIMIILFEDTLHPYRPTDTLTKLPAWYQNYQFNVQGQAIDSVLVVPDSILYKREYAWYGTTFEVLERYELARYITPYGNGLSLGDGWTWVYDLTDYALLLRDSVHLSAGNWQELLDMKFRMIEGVPPRDVLGVANIYTGNHGYANASQHNLPPVSAKIDTNVRNARLKMRITGHGFGGTDNCSEFCPRNNTLNVNGQHAYDHYVWRNDCGLNPLYPQGGTWLYDRAEWCPGAEVRTMDFELSKFISPGDSLTIDYDLQPGYTWDGQGSWPYYAIESQLITYSKPSFRLDAAMEEVLSPRNDRFYNRYNPVCGRPLIAIKNNGSDTLTNLMIRYGPRGGRIQSYAWTGRLTFQDTTRILLPPIDWEDWTGGDNIFQFEVALPNGKTDENPLNNAMNTPFTIPPTYENQLILKFKTNHMAASLSWTLTDQDDHVVYQNGPLENNTIYRDTFSLQKGCYRLSIRNAEGEGLNYWANMPPYGNGTSGYAQLGKMDGTILRAFQGDFGREIAQSFTAGMTIDVPDLNPHGYATVYPNPTSGKAELRFITGHPGEIMLTITDIMGRVVSRKSIKTGKNSAIPVHLENEPKGVYLISISTQSGSIIKKVVKK